jgi:hypothetical protein
VEDRVRWHRAYDDPATALARRLALVRRRVAEALGVLGSRAGRVLSLCAGDGRDVLPVLAVRALAAGLLDGGPGTVVVEKDPTLATRAEDRARAHGLDGVRVVVGDAGDPGVFADVLPVDGHPEPFGVGVAHLPDLPASAPTPGGSPPEHLFTFLR